jgi:hypothetical protein
MPHKQRAGGGADMAARREADICRVVACQCDLECSRTCERALSCTGFRRWSDTSNHVNCFVRDHILTDLNMLGRPNPLNTSSTQSPSIHHLLRAMCL